MKAALFLFALALVGAGSTDAAPLASGNYRLQVPLGPVLLNGRYPFFVNEGLADRQPVEGRLDVTTSPTGKISGKVEIFAEIADVTGQIKIRKAGVTLKLHGKTERGTRVTVNTLLNGTAFTGKVKLGPVAGPARIDVEGIAPITLEYALALTAAANGKLTGAGTLKSDVAEVPVTVRGRTNDVSATLRITGGKTMFEGGGPTSGTGFTAKWKAQGFGALVKGERLPVTRE